MRDDAWLYPIVEIVHIVGIALLVGAAAMFDLRLLGFGRTLPVQALARHLLPWSWVGLLLIVPSGLLMFTTQPELLDNGVFLLKLALIAVAGVNAFVFHAGPWRVAGDWPQTPPARARLHAVLSLLLWIAVIACGRLLAYV
ncbi:DUF6644 family protein [Telluria beijingensis]|uniref:DUF6644 family protein n=1 Tax=Telluria beijingensis TaxID=3068633 RepID=UPI002795F3C7|nr:DUF6644 family protein [Massilia sp. REN29]